MSRLARRTGQFVAQAQAGRRKIRFGRVDRLSIGESDGAASLVYAQRFFAQTVSIKAGEVAESQQVVVDLSHDFRFPAIPFPNERVFN